MDVVAGCGEERRGFKDPALRGRLGHVLVELGGKKEGTMNRAPTRDEEGGRAEARPYMGDDVIMGMRVDLAEVGRIWAAI